MSADIALQGTAKGRKKLTGWIVGGAVALVAALTALALVLLGVIPVFGGSSSDDALRLEGAEEPGAAAFMVADLVNPSSLITPIKKGAAVPAPPTTVALINGTTPGLYGGTGAETCDPAQLKAFLGANPDKAAAWVGALNADPNLRWGNGQKLTVAEIPVYIDNLIPTVLQQDTRVTNHGFADGTATPFQAVLQRGTSVFVDRFGVPRARCLCGNPLLPPKQGEPQTPKTPPASETPCIPVPGSYVDCPSEEHEVPPLPIEGDPWEGFGDTPPTLVDPNDEPVDELKVMDENGELKAVAVPFCEAHAKQHPGEACPSPSPENATQVTGGGETAAPADPADPAQQAGAFQNPSPAGPAGDVCANAFSLTGGSGRPSATVTNNTDVVVDLWGTYLEWDEAGVITSCQPEYAFSLHPGATTDFDHEINSMWVAVDPSGGLRSEKITDGSAWSIS